jgi:hypothetical protein
MIGKLTFLICGSLCCVLHSMAPMVTRNSVT